MFLFLLISIGSVPDKIGSSSVQVDLIQPLTNLRRSFKDVSSFLFDGFDSIMGTVKHKASAEVCKVVKSAPQWLLVSFFSTFIFCLLLLRCLVNVGGKRYFSVLSNGIL